jgi:hypothetical protein
MKHLFVSDERLIQQQYRRGIIFRLTGVLILFATFLQLPALLLAGLSWKRHHDEESTRNELRAEVNNLQKANTPLNDVRRKLDQIRQWDPNIVLGSDNMPWRGCVRERVCACTKASHAVNMLSAGKAPCATTDHTLT